MSLTSQRMRVNGVSLNVVVQGQGEPLLLLHGFPDSSYLWRDVIPILVQAGYQVIAPDQRGFGESDAPVGKRHYSIETIVADTIGLLDALGVKKVKLAGHDWGAVIGWYLAGIHPDRVDRFAAISVGHPNAYRRAGWEQKRKGWSTLLFQIPGVAEKALRANDWAMLRKPNSERQEVERQQVEHWIADLSRPGRLTAGLNWYRANLFKILTSGCPRVSAPVLGIWSTNDFVLAEDQMTNSAKYVDASWRYERIEGVGHWAPLEIPGPLGELLLEFFR